MTGASCSPWLFPGRIQVQNSTVGIADSERGELHACPGFHDCDLRDSDMRTGFRASAEAAIDPGALRLSA